MERAVHSNFQHHKEVSEWSVLWTENEFPVNLIHLACSQNLECVLIWVAMETSSCIHNPIWLLWKFLWNGRMRYVTIHNHTVHQQKDLCEPVLLTMCSLLWSIQRPSWLPLHLYWLLLTGLAISCSFVLTTSLQ